MAVVKNKKITEITNKTSISDTDLLLVGDNGTDTMRTINWGDATEEISASLSSLRENLSNPNLLINGDFQVWQRGTSFNETMNTSANVRYTADRWCTYYEGKTFTVNKGANGGITISKEHGLFQLLETHLEVGATYTLSAKVNNEVKTLTFVAGTPVADNGLQYRTWRDGAYDCIQVLGDTSSSRTIYWVKLEKGSIATPFVPRPYAEELAMCQRYYQNLTYNGSVIFYYSSSNKRYIVSIQFSPMRIPPSLIHVSCGYYNSSTTWSVVEGASSIDTVKTTYMMFITNTISESPRDESLALLVDAKLDAEIY